MIKLKGITWDHSRGYDPLVASSALYLEQMGIQVEWQKKVSNSFWRSVIRIPL